MKKLENQLKQAELLKIEFPLFWNNAYNNKNRFFYLVFDEAKQFVEILGLDEKYLKEDNCIELWERHCEFCFEKITTNIKKVCYCTIDCVNWICDECYNKYKDEFEWKVVKVHDIPEKGVVLNEIKISK